MVRESGAAVSHSTSVIEEHFSPLFGLLDEKYKDVPEKVSALRRDLDEHVSDRSVHTGSASSVSPVSPGIEHPRFRAALAAASAAGTRRHFSPILFPAPPRDAGSKASRRAG